jgi:hypothetical protein
MALPITLPGADPHEAAPEPAICLRTGNTTLMPKDPDCRRDFDAGVASPFRCVIERLGSRGGQQKSRSGTTPAEAQAEKRSRQQRPRRRFGNGDGVGFELGDQSVGSETRRTEIVSPAKNCPGIGTGVQVDSARSNTTDSHIHEEIAERWIVGEG